MRKLTVVLVAAMILLAGCSGGGGGAASPTEDSEMNATATGTGNGNSTSSDIAPQSAVSDNNPFSSATEIDGTWYNGSQQSSALIRNDTSNDRKLVEYTDESGTTSELYTTEDYVAVRNGTTGDVQYGGPDSFIGAGVGISGSFTAGGALFYVGVVEWEQTGTTTVDGEQATVYESDSLNETGLNTDRSISYGFDQSEVQSVDGEMVISSEGQIHSANIEIETQDGTYGGEMSVEYGDINLTKPAWVDESEAP